MAPSTDASSSGEEMAARAASPARFSPLAMPMPINAEPASHMIVRTSAKSRLIKPGTVRPAAGHARPPSYAGLTVLRDRPKRR